MALYIFWEKLGWLPGTGYVAFSESPGEWFQHLILPWFVLALLYAAFYARMTRGNLLDVMGEDYIRTARAKGLSERRVIFKHGLRASLTPIITMFGMDVALLIGGAVITETVFNFQGLGAWAVTVDLPGGSARRRRRRAGRRRGRGALQPHRRRALRLPRPAGALPVTAEPLLEVENLAVEFPTPDGIVHAVDGLTFTVHRGETFGIVGESGSGKSVTNLALLGLLNRERTRISGTARFMGQDLISAPISALRQVRGKDIAMIFQDPFACLHPMYTVGDQIVEAVRVHENIPKAQALQRAVDLLGAVGHPEPAPARQGLSAPVLGRHAAARHDRHGDDQQPGSPDRRRADHGARRHGAGADPRADRPGEAGVQHRRDPDHTRPGRDRRGRADRHGHVRGPLHGARLDRGRLPAAAPPLHVGPARVDSARRAEGIEPRADRGLAPVADLRPSRLPVSPALPAPLLALRPGAARVPRPRRRARGRLPSRGSTTSGGCGSSARPGACRSWYEPDRLGTGRRGQGRAAARTCSSRSST